MRLLANVEMSFQIIEKRGLHYAQAFDTDSLNLVFEEESLTYQGAVASLANFLVTVLTKKEN